MAKKKDKKRIRKKEKKVVSSGVLYIHSTFNNTIITVTDRVGMFLPGDPVELLGLKVPGNRLPLLHNWLQRKY